MVTDREGKAAKVFMYNVHVLMQQEFVKRKPAEHCFECHTTIIEAMGLRGTKCVILSTGTGIPTKSYQRR